MSAKEPVQRQCVKPQYIVVFWILLTCIIHNLVPALMLPGCIPCVFSGLEVFVGWNQSQYVSASGVRNYQLPSILQKLVSNRTYADTGHKSLKVWNARWQNISFLSNVWMKLVLLTPEMVHHVQVANLGEEPSYCLTVMLPVANGSGPVQQRAITLNPDQGHRLYFLRQFTWDNQDWDSSFQGLMSQANASECIIESIEEHINIFLNGVGIISLNKQFPIYI